MQPAAEAMTERSIGGAPVVDDEGNVVGMLNDDDLIVSDVRLHMPTVISVLGAYLELPSSASRFDKEVRKAVGATVGDVMTEGPETCSEDATVEEVATTLHERNVSRLPVVRDGKWFLDPHVKLSFRDLGIRRSEQRHHDPPFEIRNVSANPVPRKWHGKNCRTS